MPNPSLDDLAVFLAVAREGGVSGAAAKLELPKSSVSRALARLEAAMHVELVHRTTRRSRLSTAGEALLERVEPLLGGLHAAVAHLPERETSPAGLLRITCTVDLGASVVAPVVARFVEAYPSVRVDVHATNALVDLIGGGFDLAIRISPRRRMADSSLVARRVGVLETRLVAAPAYLARHGHPRTPRDLERHHWVTYGGAESIVLEAPGSVERLAARGAIRCDDMLFAHAAARAGAGIVLLPSFLAKPSLEDGELVAVLPKWKMPSGALWLVHPAARNPPAKVSAFCEFAFDTLATSLR